MSRWTKTSVNNGVSGYNLHMTFNVNVAVSLFKKQRFNRYHLNL